MSDSEFIVIRNVSRHFGRVRAVDQVSLAIAKGEFFGLLGSSGCGKTTLLRMLAGFESPTRGELYIDGQSVLAVPPYQRPVNMVFQNYAIFPHLNVAQNIAYGLRKDRLSKQQTRRKVDEVLELIKLEGYGQRGADELSGGQRQRVALARALIKKPKVLLLDEPLGALDKKLREQMQIELRQLQKDVGITFVFVTHDQEEALTMSDRIAVMSEGKVLEVGSPEQLYERPDTRFVADFLGTMNFFAGIIQNKTGSAVEISVPALGLLRSRHTTELPINASVWVAIRPENIRIGCDQPAHQNNSVRGKMGNAAYLGDRAHLYIDIENSDQRLLAAMQNVEGSASSAAQGSQNITLSWSDKSVILFAA